MSLQLFVITGSSRGLGLALAQRLLHQNHILLCVSRQVNAALQLQAEQVSCHLTQWPADLQDASPTAKLLGNWLADLAANHFAQATLINNAAYLPTPQPLAQTPTEDVLRTLRVGLEAPMLLTSAFLNATAHWTGQRRVLNISSGLGRRPMASQSPYCAAKAGLDLFSRCAALDEAQLPRPARIVSLAPGVIDTDMQAQLRGAEPAQFPDQPAFAQLKHQQQLTSAQEAAARVLAFLNRSDFGDQVIADVRHS